MKSQMYNIFPGSSLMYCRKVSFVYQGLEFTSVTFPEAIHEFYCFVLESFVYSYCSVPDCFVSLKIDT